MARYTELSTIPVLLLVNNPGNQVHRSVGWQLTPGQPEYILLNHRINLDKGFGFTVEINRLRIRTPDT